MIFLCSQSISVIQRIKDCANKFKYSCFYVDNFWKQSDIYLTSFRDPWTPVNSFTNKKCFVWVTYTLVLNIQFASYIDIMFLIGSPETDVLYFINHNIIKQESKESRDN